MKTEQEIKTQIETLQGGVKAMSRMADVYSADGNEPMEKAVSHIVNQTYLYITVLKWVLMDSDEGGQA